MNWEDEYAELTDHTRRLILQHRNLRMTLHRIASLSGATTDDTATLARIQTCGAIAECALNETDGL